MRRPSAALDASALIAYIVSERGTDIARIERALADGAVVSAPNWSEVLHRLRVVKGRTPEETEGLLTELGILGPMLEVRSFDRVSARSVAHVIHDIPEAKRAGIGIADVSCLSLAREHGIPALTTDDKWPAIAGAIRVAVEIVGPGQGVKSQAGIRRRPARNP